jgi:hypothetical protein
VDIRTPVWYNYFTVAGQARQTFRSTLCLQALLLPEWPQIPFDLVGWQREEGLIYAAGFSPMGRVQTLSSLA